MLADMFVAWLMRRTDRQIKSGWESSPNRVKLMRRCLHRLILRSEMHRIREKFHKRKFKL